MVRRPVGGWEMSVVQSQKVPDSFRELVWATKEMKMASGRKEEIAGKSSFRKIKKRDVGVSSGFHRKPR